MSKKVNENLMFDKYGRAVDSKEWEEKEAKGLNETYENTIYDLALIKQALIMQKDWLKSLNIPENGRADKVMFFIIENGKIKDTKLIKRQDVYDYKPQKNEYYLNMERDTGWWDTDYVLPPVQKMVDIWNDSKKWELKEKESKINEDEQFAPDSAAALADFLGTDFENVSEMDYDHYGIPMYKADGEEWAVTDDYDLVEEAAKKEVISLIDEMGVDSLNWYNMGGLENYLDKGWFQEAMEESNQFYIDDIREESASSDEYENRLAEEMADAGVETEEEYLDVLNSNYSDPIEWYIDNFGKEDLNSLIKEGRISIDSEKAAEEVLTTDGPGHLLSVYDGEMVEHEFEGTTFYMFRQN